MQIRKIQKKDYEKAAYIKSISFYADEKLSESIENIIQSFKDIEKIKDCDVFVCECDGGIAGLITVNKFSMNFYGKFTDIYALSGVSVDTAYRGRGIADKLICFFLDYSEEQNADMVMLYPFRPSFYKKYGFGWGIEKYEYTINTAHCKFYENKNIYPFAKGSVEHSRNIQNEYAKTHHGMCLVNDYEWHNFKNDVSDDNIVLIKDDEGKYIGYAIIEFEKDPQYNPYDQTILVQRLVTLTPDGHKWFLSYIHCLKDQFQTAKVYTYDKYFYYNLNNAGSIYDAVIPSGYHHICRCGLGIMYKAINAQRLLTLLDNKDMKTGYCFIIWDKYNNSYTKAYFGAKEEPQEININIEDFTSFIMGCIPAEQLHALGLINCEKNTAVEIDTIFRLKQPICISTF
ncbi:MAG: GNAT family N-acetyltransferase [Eubacteriaceae bacterium]|nr:GNAT family N-acetyltransferase [Eubacteriaceae bacterium]